MPTMLKKLKIRRCALVDKGANQEAFVTLFKRDDTQEVPVDDQETAAVEETPVIQEPEVVAKADYEAVVLKVAELESAATAAREQAEKATAELAKRDEEIEIAKFVAEAEKLPLFGDKGPSWLRTVAKALGEDYPAFRERLAATQEQVQQSALFKEVGSAVAVDASDPGAVARVLAKRFQESDPSLTNEQAISRAYATPEYKAARKAAGGK